VSASTGARRQPPATAKRHHAGTGFACAAESNATAAVVAGTADAISRVAPISWTTDPARNSVEAAITELPTTTLWTRPVSCVPAVLDPLPASAALGCIDTVAM
jgi:uncharacterized protein (DUF1499 family)